MKISKIIRGVFALILLGSVILWGCTGQTSTISKKDTDPTDQSAQSEQVIEEEAVNENDTTPIATEEATSSKDGSKSDNTVRILISDEVTTLDPYRMVTIHPEGSIAAHLWDTLTWLNDNLQIEPHLAESWRLVNNFTWEIKLRQGITFHNGEVLNAEAARFSIERAQSMPGSLETFSRDVGLENVEVVDEYTLRLTTGQPVVNLPYHLAFLEILPPLYYSETDADRLAAAPIGSGPYQLKGWTQNKELVLEAVPTYWKGKPALPRLVFETVPLPEERLAALRLDKADLVTDLPPMSIDEWSSPTSKLATIESTQRMLVGINIEEGSPLADKQVRQALNYGLNVEQIITDWLKGYGERYGSWVNPPSNNPKLAPWSYDPEMARDLLAQAGYGEGFTTTLRTPSGAYHQDVAIANAIAQQLGEMGVNVEVETVDWTTYGPQLLSDNKPPLFLLGLNSRGDAIEDTKNLSIDFSFNPTGWQNERFEDTLRRAVNTFNEPTRATLLNDAQAIAYDEAPWIWLWRQYDFYGINQNLDWSPRRDGLVYLYKPAADSDKVTE